MSRQSTISRVKVLHQSRQTTEKVWLYIGQLFAVQRQIITMHTQNHISFIMFCNIVTTVDGFNRKQFTTKAEYQHYRYHMNAIYILHLYSYMAGNFNQTVDVITVVA